VNPSWSISTPFRLTGARSFFACSTAVRSAEISPGRAYFPHHAGFDHRPLFRAIADRLALERRTGSPFSLLPAWLNSEVYLRARRRG